MSTVFLYTFFVGFGLTLVSALLGAIDAGGDVHGGHGHGGHADGGHLGSDGGHHGHVYGDIANVSPINFQTIVAFLMGFGGIGYLALEFGPVGPVVGIAIALTFAAAGGVVVSWLIYRWLRFLVRGERPLPPTSHVGVMGRLTVGIREGGTGEIVYTVHGTRAVSSARSVDGKPIAKGQEVVVLRYDKGIAYVQPLDQLMADENKGGSST